MPPVTSRAAAVADHISPVREWRGQRAYRVRVSRPLSHLQEWSIPDRQYYGDRRHDYKDNIMPPAVRRRPVMRWQSSGSSTTRVA